MCGVPEEAIVKREKEEEREKPRQMQNIQVLWAKAVKKKTKLFEQAGVVEEESNNSPAKNHKSFTVEYPLLRVFCLLILDMLLSKQVLVAVEICRGNRRREAIGDSTQIWVCLKTERSPERNLDIVMYGSYS